MDDRQLTLRVSIEGNWTADDMAQSFASIRDLYLMRLAIEALAEQAREADAYLREPFPMPYPLRRAMRLFAVGGMAGWIEAPPLDVNRLSRLCDVLAPGLQLQARRIEYASPGIKDLVGAGEVVGHIKDFIVFLVEHLRSRKARQLENEEHRLRNDAMRLENAHRFIAMKREFDLTPSEMRRLQMWVDDRQQPLAALVTDGKIRGATILEERDTDSKN